MNKRDDSITVLFVDDEPLCRDVVVDMLKPHRIIVSVAHSAEEAIDILETRTFDAIITDLLLPGMNGVGLLNHIREDDPDLPVILVTGFSSVNSAIKALKLGAQDYILKPMGNCEILSVAIRKAVTHHRLAKQNKLLYRKLAEATEHERRVLGRELHDVLCQDISTITMLSSLLQKSLKQQAPALLSDVAMIQLLAARSVAFVRRLCTGLFPAELGQDGLHHALENLAVTQSHLFDIPCTYAGDPELDIPEGPTALNIFRIAQEAVINSVKHSKAQHIAISLAKKNGDTVLTVSDDGQGFDPDSNGDSGLGLHIMHYRADVIGAALEISGYQDTGTEVRCTWQ